MYLIHSLKKAQKAKNYWKLPPQNESGRVRMENVLQNATTSMTCLQDVEQNDLWSYPPFWWMLAPFRFLNKIKIFKTGSTCL